MALHGRQQKENEDRLTGFLRRYFAFLFIVSVNFHDLHHCPAWNLLRSRVKSPSSPEMAPSSPMEVQEWTRDVTGVISNILNLTNCLLLQRPAQPTLHSPTSPSDASISPSQSLPRCWQPFCCSAPYLTSTSQRAHRRSWAWLLAILCCLPSASAWSPKPADRRVLGRVRRMLLCL